MSKISARSAATEAEQQMEQAAQVSIPLGAVIERMRFLAAATDVHGAIQCETFSRAAELLERQNNLLKASRRWVEEAGTINGYGFYRPENPHDFSPDHESCTDEEVANHRAACEAWDRGDYKREPGSESFYNEAGELSLHITRAPWGVGSYTDTIDEAADLLAAIDAITGAAA